MTVIVLGVAMILAGAILTMSYSKNARSSGATPSQLLAQNVVPKWVSLLYLAGFVVTIVGVIAALV